MSPCPCQHFLSACACLTEFPGFPGKWVKFDLFELIFLICKFGMKLPYYKVIIENQ